MGHACPVCGDPQVDAEHLANHLAFTAMLGDADHEQWLDDHAPDWGQRDPEALAKTVAEHADSVEFPQVFEDTTDDHAHDHEDRSGALFDDESDLPPGAHAGARDDGELDPEARRILDEARALTSEMTEDADDED